MSVCVLAMVLGGDRAARADPHEGGEALSASPDAPASGLAWRGYMRGTVGAALPIVRPGAGAWRLELLPLIELHNTRGDAFPNHLWRGRLALGATVRATPSVAVSVLLEHESDHRTASGGTPPTGWLVLNDLGLRVSWLAPASFTLLVRGTARTHFLTCTVDHLECATDLGLEGSLGVSGTVEAIVDAAHSEGDAPGLTPFAAILAEALAPSDRIVGEARLVVNAGVTALSRETGRWQLLGIAWLGNDVGFRRERRVAHVGAAVRWSPR